MKSIFEPEEPLVHIGIAGKVDTLLWNDITVGQTRVTSHWNREPGKKYTVNVYTNGDEVELFVNGNSLGTKRNDNKRKPNIITWKGVEYVPGAIEAVARKDGKPVARHRVETAGEPVSLKMVAENTGWKGDGMDLQYVRVYAVDRKGRVVPTAVGRVSFEVEGAARLIAVDNGDHSSGELFCGNSKALYEGFAMAIVRSARKPGKVRVTARCDGLKSASATLVTE